jgi:hypothetical protein
LETRPLKEQKTKSRNKKHHSSRDKKKNTGRKSRCPLKCPAEFSTIRKPPAFQSRFAINLHPLCSIAPVTFHNKAATLGKAYNLATAMIPGVRHMAWHNKGFPD